MLSFKSSAKLNIEDSAFMKDKNVCKHLFFSYFHILHQLLKNC